MAQWSITDNHNGELENVWDDGDTFASWEEGFSNAKVTEYAGAGNFNYMGTPNWIPPESRAAPEGGEG